MREDVVLRFLRPEDAAALAGLEGEVFADAWSAERFVSLLAAGVFGGGPETRRDALLHAYVSAYSVAGELEIVNVAVRTALRGQGLGTRLLLFFLREAAGRGVGRAVLEVRRGNVAAHALYARCGFTAIGRRKKYYADTGEDALVLEWRPEAFRPGGPAGSAGK
ncbi:MAG: ribosomal protein S18-alanine N-acetyltransferase [Pseudomonadota bacterium]|nr:ribosomal protein S18-alanine N-acetyltransferase [Pseudomonadota bacterium]